MRDELRKIYESVLEIEVDTLAEPEDFETSENQLVLEHLRYLTKQVEEVTVQQQHEDEVNEE